MAVYSPINAFSFDISLIEIGQEIKLLEHFKKFLDHLYKLGTGCKDTLVICNSIFFIFLNQIKAQRDQKIIVWVEYFPNKYSFKVISND
jgi:hypothetical protein